MIRLFQWLIYGHIHTWETIKEVNLTKRLYESRNQDPYESTGSRYVLRCKKCGKIKFQDVI